MSWNELIRFFGYLLFKNLECVKKNVRHPSILWTRKDIFSGMLPSLNFYRISSELAPGHFICGQWRRARQRIVAVCDTVVTSARQLVAEEWSTSARSQRRLALQPSLSANWKWGLPNHNLEDQPLSFQRQTIHRYRIWHSPKAFTNRSRSFQWVILAALSFNIEYRQ